MFPWDSEVWTEASTVDIANCSHDIEVAWYGYGSPFRFMQNL